MLRNQRGTVSNLFVRIGEFAPKFITRKAILAGERIALGLWYKNNFKSEISPVSHRFELLSIAVHELNENFTYLEFGVASGDSMRFVAHLTQDMHGIELHGFDSFTGLAESHHENVIIGSFDQSGAVPQIQKVKWHIGFFEDTFFGDENYLGKKLCLMLDADLYSSTSYVLGRISSKLKDGDLIYCDDLHIPNQERLALADAIRSGLNLELVARSVEGRSALFRVIKK